MELVNRIALDRRQPARDDMQMRQLPLILLLACTACRAAGPAATTPPSLTASPSLPDQMRALVGAAACTDSAQCKTVALGARACGGPEGYLAYSTATTPSAPLHALAQRYAEQSRAGHATSGMMSTCQFISDPGAQCRAGSCQLGAAAGPV